MDHKDLNLAIFLCFFMHITHTYMCDFSKCFPSPFLKNNYFSNTVGIQYYTRQNRI